MDGRSLTSVNWISGASCGLGIADFPGQLHSKHRWASEEPQKCCSPWDPKLPDDLKKISGIWAIIQRDPRCECPSWAIHFSFLPQVISIVPCVISILDERKTLYQVPKTVSLHLTKMFVCAACRGHSSSSKSSCLEMILYLSRLLQPFAPNSSFISTLRTLWSP